MEKRRYKSELKRKEEKDEKEEYCEGEDSVDEGGSGWRNEGKRTNRMKEKRMERRNVEKGKITAIKQRMDEKGMYGRKLKRRK